MRGFVFAKPLFPSLTKCCLAMNVRNAVRDGVDSRPECKRQTQQRAMVIKRWQCCSLCNNPCRPDFPAAAIREAVPPMSPWRPARQLVLHTGKIAACRRSLVRSAAILSCLPRASTPATIVPAHQVGDRGTWVFASAIHVLPNRVKNHLHAKDTGTSVQRRLPPP